MLSNISIADFLFNTVNSFKELAYLAFIYL
jgi:hypothetical protein